MKTTSKNHKNLWLDPPYILEHNKEKIQLILFASLFTILFLLIFQPFGVNNYDRTHSIKTEFVLAVCGFGLVVGVTLFIFEFIIAPRLFKKRSWTILIIRLVTEICMVATSVFLFYNWMGDFHDWNLKSYLGFIRDIALSSIVPLLIIVLVIKYKRTKEDYLNLLEHSNKSSIDQKKIVFGAENSKNNVIINLTDLLFIRAEDNYVVIYFLEAGHVKKHLLRSTMKNVSKYLRDYPIVRCHRSYMVHLNKVKKSESDGHKMKLMLHDTPEIIPVSRSYNNEIKEILSAYHN